jgi:hypothetical protein
MNFRSVWSLEADQEKKNFLREQMEHARVVEKKKICMKTLLTKEKCAAEPHN